MTDLNKLLQQPTKQKEVKFSGPSNGGIQTYKGILRKNKEGFYIPTDDKELKELEYLAEKGILSKV